MNNILSKKEIHIFDLDKTIIHGDSEEIWLEFLKKTIPTVIIKSSEREILLNRYREGENVVHEIVNNSISPVKGLSRYKIEKLAKYAFIKDGIQSIKPAIFKKINILKENNCYLMLVSATNTPIVKSFSEYLGFDCYIGSNIEYFSGICTGQVRKYPCHGLEKKRLIENFLLKNINVFNKSVFYGDSHNDIHVMKIVNEAIAVNPDRKLWNYCIDKNWKIIDI